MTQSAGPAQARPWLANYPASLPGSLEAAFPDMLAGFRSAVSERGDHEAIRYFNASLTYGEIDALSDAFAHWLAERGIGRGDRIAIVLQNVPHAVISAIAAWKLGAIPVPANPMYRAAELGMIFADCDPSCIVCHPDQCSLVVEALALADCRGIPVVTADPHDFAGVPDVRVVPAACPSPANTPDLMEICASRRGGRPEAILLDPGETGLILYTSGTTGQPKGAVLSHASLAFNSSVASVCMGLHEDSRLLGLAPLFHITGFVLHIGVAIAARGSLALNYRFHPQLVVEMIRSYRPTFTIAAITAFNALMNDSDGAAADFACFDACFTGGAPVSPALRDQVYEKLGISLLPVYGMTESCAPSHIAPLGSLVPVDPATGALSVGLPMPLTDARIVTPGGTPAPVGTPGEIWLRGPHIMRGYWNKPEETAAALEDGWLKSGDIGVMDEQGWFYVVDRQKDVINASGFKVWPRQVEDALQLHPAVREAAVIGVPDPYRGESVCAYVSLIRGVSPPPVQDLIAHCRVYLAAYKVPRVIHFLDELPKTQTGKIQRSALRGRDAAER